MKKNKTNTTQTKNNLSPFGENILGQLKDSIFARNPEISDRESLERICLKMQRDIKKDQKIGHEVNTKYLKAIREYLFSVYKYYYSSY